MSPRAYRTEETVNVAELIPLWQRLEELDTEQDLSERAYRRGQDLSDRRLDEAHELGLRVWMYCASMIGAAREANQYLIDSLQIGVRPTASWAPLRPAFEAAVWALWVLEPKRQTDRFARGLRVLWADHRQRELWLEDFRSPETRPLQDRQSEIGHLYRSFAAQAGVPWKTDRLNTEQIIKNDLQVLRRPPSSPALQGFVAATWRQLSSVMHSNPSMVMAVSQHRIVAEVPGGFQAVITPSDTAFVSACRVAAYMQAMAMRCFVDGTAALSRP